MASSEPTEWLSFSGAPEEKAAMFVQNLNRKAFAQGKSKDDEWLAQYAAACLSDDALTWYYSLAEEVQNSWRKMCPALLKEFSNKPAAAAKVAEVEAAESDIIPAAAPPAPAPAPPPPPPAPAPAPASGWNSSSARTPSPAYRASRTPAEQSSTTRIGYIEIVDALSGDRFGYISNKDNKIVTQDTNDALLFELPLAASPSNPVSLRTVNSTGDDPEKAYAGILTATNPPGWWILTSCAPGNNQDGEAITMSNVWTVHRIAEILELKLLCPPQFTSDGSSRLYLGEYVLPIDSIAIQWLKMNPSARSDDMLCVYRKSDLDGFPGFSKLRMIFRQTQ